MSGENDFNKAIIEEFRANSGKVGGYFAGRPGNRFLLDMDFLLYEVSAQRGDAHQRFRAASRLHQS